MGTLEELIRLQLDTNRSKNLLYTGAAEIMEIGPEFEIYLEAAAHAQSEERRGDRPDVAARFAARSFADRVTATNPYLRISDEAVTALERIYRETFSEIDRLGNVAAALRQYHYPALSAWVAELYPPQLKRGLRLAPVVRGLVYGQYSAAMQLELLELNPTKLQAPVLDVGCGCEGSLVRYLRSLGVDAYGIDRRLGVAAPYLVETDWFEYPLGTARWGTIISNMAFSNHLTYALTQDRTQLAPYLARMRDLLDALVTGGSFIYSPGLRQIEDGLPPGQYRVRRVRSAGGIEVSVVTRVG